MIWLLRQRGGEMAYAERYAPGDTARSALPALPPLSYARYSDYGASYADAADMRCSAFTLLLPCRQAKMLRLRDYVTLR